jgi:hypothetical protein
MLLPLKNKTSIIAEYMGIFHVSFPFYQCEFVDQMLNTLKNTLSIFFLISILTACSGLDFQDSAKIRKENEKGEFIYRESDEFLHKVTAPKPRKREKYPWEDKIVGNFPRINKEFFRCKGSSLNILQVELDEKGELTKYQDCTGRHSLPLQNKEEHIFPILLELLNFVQEKTGKRVVITSGHRCPKHNSYCDSSTNNRTSKHMVGGEVAFYVQGMEKKPEKVLELLQLYFKETSFYKGKKEYEEFSFYDGPTNVSSIPLRNKEVYIKIFNSEEGRNFDNRHSFPYISIQVRYDKTEDKGVFYTWNKAYNQYYRW